jgi:hypothetical protein
MTLLQDIIGLIAYNDPSQSPIAHYMAQERRDKVASLLNSHILCNFYWFMISLFRNG